MFVLTENNESLLDYRIGVVGRALLGSVAAFTHNFPNCARNVLFLQVGESKNISA